MSINEVRWLSECGSTNAYAKEHFEEFGPVGAVYTTNQTAGRGRLGRSWVNAEGRALYYTAVIREPLAQPATLPLLASLAVRDQLAQRYGVDCQIKWPNDLLLNGKKIVGILCESVSYGYQMQGRGIVCGIGINLAQPQSYFDAANLPNGTSLELQGAKVDLAADPQWLAEALTDFGFDRPLYTFAREGFAPFRDEYKAACVNLGRHVTFDLPGGGTGSGTAIDVDADGQLIVRTDSGEGLYRRSLRPRHLRGRINFPAFQRLCRPSGPGGAFLFSLQSLWKTRVFPRFSTHGFCQAVFVENSCAKNSRGERRFCPKRETPQKINFWPRLSFQKKALRPLFSPDFPSFPVLEYIVYNPKLNFLWKTRWKKWKTLWENPLLFHKIGGKPSGKS